MQINWGKGLFRGWLVASGLWIAAIGWIGVSDLVKNGKGRYYYDPKDNVLQQTYFGLSNAARFERGEILEVRYAGISVVFISGDGKNILLPIKASGRSSLGAPISEQEEAEFRHRPEREWNQAKPAPQRLTPSEQEELRRLTLERERAGSSGRVVPDWDLPDAVKASKGRFVPDTEQEVEATQAITQPILEGARTEWRSQRLKTSLSYLSMAVIPPLVLLTAGMLALWIGRGFLSYPH